MGNNHSSNNHQTEKKHHHHHHHHSTATSLLTYQLNQQNQIKHQNQNLKKSSNHSIDQIILRKRKSLELPDLNPHSSIDPPLSALSIDSNHTTNSNNRSKLQSDLTHFQLKLPSASIANRPTTPSNSSSSPKIPISNNIYPHPHQQQPTSQPLNHQVLSTQSSSPSQIEQDLQSTPTHQLSDLPPTSLSSAPLPQPIETVVPPVPPLILQPFPPPLLSSLELDSSDLPISQSTALSTAVTETVAAATAVVQASPALDIGAGSDGVPTLLTWKEPAQEVYVTGTFSKWKQQIKLRKPITSDQSQQDEAFSALVSLPPGPHQLKFIVDKRWKTSKYLPSATDDKGNLINYLQVNPGDQPFRGLGPRGIWSGYTYGGWSSILEEEDPTDSEDEWTSEIPSALLDYEEYHDRSEEEEAQNEEGPDGHHHPTEELIPGQAGFAAEPPKLPAQLKEGILNLSSRLPEGTSDDNSLLPKPDHSVLNHLAASPIRQGLLSVGVTSRFKRKYLTTVYYKPVDL